MAVVRAVPKGVQIGATAWGPVDLGQLHVRLLNTPPSPRLGPAQVDLTQAPHHAMVVSGCNITVGILIFSIKNTYFDALTLTSETEG